MHLKSVEDVYHKGKEAIPDTLLQRINVCSVAVLGCHGSYFAGLRPLTKHSEASIKF